MFRYARDKFVPQLRVVDTHRPFVKLLGCGPNCRAPSLDFVLVRVRPGRR